ncbi:MAG TPA: RNA polymerase sigma factor [Pseudomonadota bacterium]|nr:RNA polymerase sigma factor [Pseudomonadota bacterium]
MNGKLLRFPPAGAAAKGTVATEAPSGSGLSAEALVVACGTGDSAALGELFDRFHQTVYRFLSRYLGPRNPDLDDLVQATFLEVRRAASRFRKESSVNSWIVGIAINVARHYLRSETRRRALLRSTELPPTCAQGTPESQTAHSEFLQRLQQSILQLPEHLRAAFVMCELEGVSGPEAARLLSIREGTLWRRLHDARKLIRQGFERGTV